MSVTRRSLLVGAASAALIARTPRLAAQPLSPSFESLFAQALRHPDELEAIRALKEQPDILNSKAATPRVRPSTRKIAPEAVRMIVLFEVTSQQRYEAKYQQPVWPGGASGVTIGIGCDLGYYLRKWLDQDWTGFLDAANLNMLEPACGKKGADAKRLIPQLRSVVLPWQPAIEQFETRLLPLYIGLTLQAVGFAEQLSDKSLGALVSLVYNRGPSFNKSGDRYKEMRAIKAALISGNYRAIPDQITAMKSLWDIKKFPGLHIRRDMEAALFREGLA